MYFVEHLPSEAFHPAEIRGRMARHGVSLRVMIRNVVAVIIWLSILAFLAYRVASKRLLGMAVTLARVTLTS